MKELIFGVLLILCSVQFAYGQFNTVKPIEKKQIIKIDNEETDNIVENKEVKKNASEVSKRAETKPVEKIELKNKGIESLFEELGGGSFRGAYGKMQGVLVDTKQAVESGQPIEVAGKKIETQPIMNFLYDMVDFVKGDLTGQIESEIRKTSRVGK